MPSNPLRSLPSVHELLESPTLKALVERISRNTLVSTVRTVLDEVRNEVQSAATDRTLPSVSDLAERISRRVAENESAVLRPVVNATGVLLHAALGRAPLAEEAIAEMAAVARDYANLELDLADGRQSRRQEAVEGLLQELTGAEAATVAGSHGAAAMLTLAALAAGREVIVSRGQVIESGDGSRLTDAMAAAGVVLREVGATNTTRADDYVQAIGQQSGALILIHASCFAVVGFAVGVALEDLADLGRRHKLPVIHDIGPGAILDLRQFGLQGVPTAAESIRQGADAVILSGDGLVGGPQCGIILGRKTLIEKIERHPTARALRVDKPTLAALAATLRLCRDPEKARVRIPLLSLLTTSVDNLRNRAERLAPQAAATPAIRQAEAVADATGFGGNLIHAQQIPTWCVALRPAGMTVERLAAALRTGAPAVVGRVKEDRLLLDLRSVLPRQDLQLMAALEMIGQLAHES